MPDELRYCRATGMVCELVKITNFKHPYSFRQQETQGWRRNRRLAGEDLALGQQIVS